MQDHGHVYPTRGVLPFVARLPQSHAAAASSMLANDAHDATMPSFGPSTARPLSASCHSWSGRHTHRPDQPLAPRDEDAVMAQAPHVRPGPRAGLPVASFRLHALPSHREGSLPRHREGGGVMPLPSHRVGMAPALSRHGEESTLIEADVPPQWRRRDGPSLPFRLGGQALTSALKRPRSALSGPPRAPSAEEAALVQPLLGTPVGTTLAVRHGFDWVRGGRHPPRPHVDELPGPMAVARLASGPAPTPRAVVSAVRLTVPMVRSAAMPPISDLTLDFMARADRARRAANAPSRPSRGFEDDRTKGP